MANGVCVEGCLYRICGEQSIILVFYLVKLPLQCACGCLYTEYLFFILCLSDGKSSLVCFLVLVFINAHMVIFRMALLLGPPSSGKTTMLMALAGKLHRELRVCFMILEAKPFSVY